MSWTEPKTWVFDEVVDETDMNTHVRDNLRAVLPIGTLILRVAPYTAVETAVEARWLQCNGVAVSRATYSALFNYLNGMTPALPFGVGDGSSTFNLPDLRGRGVYGQGTHANVDTLGDNEGSSLEDRGPHHYHVITSGDAGQQGNVGQDNTLDRTPNANTSGGGAQDKPAYLVIGSYFIKYTS